MSNRLFSTVPAPKVPRNIFNNSHSNKLTMTVQRIYPTLVAEILPGDKHIIAAETFARTMPMIAPVYQNYMISHHAFFVPMRTLSKHWENFITGGKNGTFTDVLPYTTLGDIYNFIDDWNTAGIVDVAPVCECIRLFDYMGLPFKFQSATSAALFLSQWLSLNSGFSTSDMPVNLAPFVAYQKIISEYYRDENIMSDWFEDLIMDSTNGLDFSDLVGYQQIVYSSTWSKDQFLAVFQMRPRAWRKDRFTSSLPFTQRGPDVLLPIAGTAPVVYKDGYLLGTGPETNAGMIVSLKPGQTDSEEASFAYYGNPSSGASYRNLFGAQANGDTFTPRASAYDPNGSLETDFTDAELTTTINDFRRAERLQRWYENSARGGARLNENTLAHWGVRTPDASLQRAEFLGGSSQPLVISEVPQTGSTDATSPQGNLAGKATSYNSGRLAKRFFSEHGYLFDLMSILMHGDYCQGIPKIFTRQDRYDYAWPEFANLGEEPVYTRELYALAPKDEVFGYTPRYSDYKSMPNEVHGDFRYTLSNWALPRTFANKPQLNEEFIYGDPSKGGFAVTSKYADEFLVQVSYGIRSSRLLPFYGVPTI